MVGLDELFHHGRNLLAPAPTVENAVMAHAASHQIFLLALRQVDRVLERRLGLAKARNIIPLTLHGKQGDIGEQEERSEEHTSELQSLMRISYAVFCLKKKNTHPTL